MPQPLSSVGPHATYRFDARTMRHHPELAAIVAQTLHIGSLIEHYSTMMLADIAHADPRSVLTMHNAITSTSGQRAALKAVAEARLPPEDYLLFQAVEKACGAARKIRNNFAHHIWADSRDIPDALLLIDPMALIEFKMPFLEPFDLETTFYADIDRSRIAVYRKRDLDEASSAVQTAFGYLAAFKGMLTETIPEMREQTRVALLRLPPIAQALHSLGR